MEHNSDNRVELQENVSELVPPTRRFVMTRDLTFDQWVALTNRAVIKICGLSIDDLADTDTYTMWDCGTLPSDAAIEILTENGFPFPDTEV